MILSPERPLALIGAGKMGGAMLAGWMAEGVDPKAVFVADPAPSQEILALLAEHGIAHGAAVPEGLTPGVVLLAVKPQVMDAVLPALTSFVADDTLVLSIAAGTPVARFTAAFGPAVPVVRVMPNTPALVGRGMSVGFAGAAVSEAMRADVARLFTAVGSFTWIEDEALMDAVTAVSGSGPAYVFYLTEALAEAGVKAGLSPDLARLLARQTVVGAGELMHRSELEPADLRRNVTSPNGTTAAALAVLMGEDGLQRVLEAAVAAAARRSRQLAG